MGEYTIEIEREIAAERSELGRHLDELERKAYRLGDWRLLYRSNPKVAIGLALAGGAMLGAMAGRRRAARHDDAPRAFAPQPRLQSRLRSQLDDTWLSITNALLGVASAKVVALIGDVVPGFSEQVNRPRFDGASGERTITK